MAEIDWTDEQLEAIQHVGRSVVVSAAAGSGKTAVLAQRCVYLVCDAPPPHRCSIDGLLVVTFTEAAAAEMKSRIRYNLQARLRDRPHDAALREQAALLESAQISTVHAFCLWLIRRWFTKVGVDPAATILAAEEARVLKAQTLDQVVSQLYDGDIPPAIRFRKLVDDYGLGRDGNIKDFALRLADHLDSLPDADGWLSQAVAGIAAGADRLARYLFEPLRLELRSQRIHAEQYARLADADDACVAFYGRLFAQHVEQLGEWEATLQTVANADTFDALGQQIREYKLKSSRAPKLPEDATEAVTDLVEALQTARKEARDRYKKRIQSRFGLFTAGEVLEGLDATVPYAEAIVDLVRRFRVAYLTEKRRRDALDFADLEALAYQLIQDDQVADSVRKRFAHVLVDEYQDINPLQDALLRRVSCEEQQDAPANLFTVGDIKQSIYRFRAAEPGVFRRRLESSGRSDRRKAVLLQHNFRSRPPILEAVNQLFMQLMQPSVGGIAYGEGERLRPGRDGHEDDRDFTVDVHLLDKRVLRSSDSDEKDEPAERVFVDPADPAEWQAIEREAFVIATEIRRIMSSGMTLDDGRPVAYGDFAVLLRSPTYRGDAIAGLLGRFGIDACTHAAGRLFDNIEIRDVRALLEVVDNMQQDIPLAALLRSSVLGAALNEDELLTVRRLDRDAPFHECVRRYVDEGAEDNLRKRLADMACSIARCRRSMRERPCAVAVEEFLEQTGYMAYVCGLSGGGQRRRNLQRFCEQARHFGTFKNQGLRRFLQFIESLEQQEQDPGAAPATSQQADAVQIMSIHAAKGLEFPIVFVAGLGTRFNLSDRVGRMILDRRAGLGLNVVDPDRMIEYPSAAHRLVAANIDRETRAEELRLLYVAMTRARERLILLGTMPPASLTDRRRLWANGERRMTPLDIEAAACALDWIVCALSALPSHLIARGGDLNDGAQTCNSDQSPERKRRVGRPRAGAWGSDEHCVFAHGDMERGALFRVVEHSGEEMADWRLGLEEDRKITPLQRAVASLAELPSEEPSLAETESVETVLERIRFDYPHLAASSVRSVVGASEVKSIYDHLRDPDEQLREHAFSRHLPGQRVDIGKKDRGDARSRGTATHMFLQHMNLDTGGRRDAVELELNRLVEAGLIATQDAALVDTGAIAWFLETPLGCTVRAAGGAYRREFMFIAAHPAQWFDPTLAGDVDERVLVRGVVDGVLEEANGIEVIDFKTDAIAADQVPRQAERYVQQMKLYAASMTSIFQRPVTQCCLVFLHPRSIVDVNQ
ncbi:MAG: UvrD-helicase domain-containing protein [Phycisphaerae bacterium]